METKTLVELTTQAADEAVKKIHGTILPLTPSQQILVAMIVRTAIADVLIVNIEQL